MKAILVTQRDGGLSAAVTDVEEKNLPTGDVTVAVHHSTVNYKDGLALAGKGVIRSFPMIPGIDFAGVVETSSDPRFSSGDRVVLNGWGASQTHWGGWAEKARVPGDWLVPLPDAFDTRQAMAIGTAGYTAMLCVLALEKNRVTPASGDVLVTGAAGGVGSVAIALLKRLGYRVVAVSGRPETRPYLEALGASEVIAREEIASLGKPIQKERWAAAIDVVGGPMLANVLASMRYRGTVAACGLAGSTDLPTTVIPFILRGVTLAGIDSVMAPRELRLEAWSRLASDLDPKKLESMVTDYPLGDAIDLAAQVLKGRLRGRAVIRVA